MENQNNRVGLFFGSFNPITNHHIRTALLAKQEAQLDEVRFVLSPLNPDKIDNEDIESTEDRWHMLSLALFQYNPEFADLRPDDTEIKLQYKYNTKYNFTYDVLKSIKNIQQEDIVLIVGDDTYYNIGYWVYGDKILKEYSIVVIPREFNSYIIEYSNGEEKILKQCDKEKGSATFAREKIKQGDFDALKQNDILPENVIDYIKIYKLYQK